MSQNAQLRVAGLATQDNSVPADVLVRAVQGIQQSVWLLASFTESREMKRRFKPDQSLRQRSTVRLSAAEPGSYAIPLSLVDESAQGVLEGTAADLWEKLTDFWEAVAANDAVKLRATISDDGYLERLLREMKKMLPRSGDEWSLSFGAAGREQVELAPCHRATVDEWLESKPQQKELCITGELQRIDFAGNRIWILYAPTKQEIECTYLQELEESIVLARRELLQVTGRFVLDSAGHPKKLMDVRSIEPVDLSLVRISEFRVGDKTLVLDPPIVISPELEADEQQSFEATITEFGFELSGRTRDELLADFTDHMAFAWQEYAEANESELTADAIRLRTRLLQRVKEA